MKPVTEGAGTQTIALQDPALAHAQEILVDLEDGAKSVLERGLPVEREQRARPHDRLPHARQLVQVTLVAQSPHRLDDPHRDCLRDARQRAAQMPELARQDGDELRAVRHSAHAIKGGAGMVGATMLAHSAAQLELGDYQKGDLPELINKLLDSCDQLQRILMTKVKAC